MKTYKFLIFRLLALLFLTVGFFSVPLYSQQIPHYTQALFNPYLVNPAVAGTNNQFQMRLANRLQWIGIHDAPVTFNISCYGPFAKYDMGWGAFIANDNTGPTSKLSIMGSYAYNLKLVNDIRISGGLSLGLMQYRLDLGSDPSGELDYDPYDPAIISSAQSKFLPDATFGLYVWNSSFNVGFSIHQLFGLKVKFYPDMIGDTRWTQSVLKQHYLLSGGYWVGLNRHWDLEASAILKFMAGAPMQAEINMRTTYHQRQYEIWGGLAFRWRDAVSILVGTNIQKKYLVGYSFDWSVLGISKYNSGSHEIMVGYLFDRLK